MKEARKKAYRQLLYMAMLDLRPYEGANSAEGADLLADNLRSIGGLAYWLHNLALSSSDDFVTFDEDGFWAQMKHFDSKYPQLDLKRYRELFDKEIG